MRFILPALVLLGIAAASQARQSTNGITVTPFSDFRDQTGYDGAESPNGKFFATADLADNYVVSHSIPEFDRSAEILSEERGLD